jgi:hypothetical protein
MKNSKRIILIFTALALAVAPARAQTLKDVFNRLSGHTRNAKEGSTPVNANNLSSSEIASGLKEALKVGAQNASRQLSATDGFFKNAAIKILLPKEAQQVEQTLRSLGMGALVDEAVLSMNRAAEDASKQAAPIFVNAISGITISDGLAILQGGNNAATQYLRSRTTARLTAAFRPVIENSLNKVGAVKIWNTVFTTYNKLPLIRKKVNPDLVSYVTEKALDGLFETIGQEELKIRTQSSAQVTSLLRKVFGGIEN